MLERFFHRLERFVQFPQPQNARESYFVTISYNRCLLAVILGVILGLCL